MSTRPGSSTNAGGAGSASNARGTSGGAPSGNSDRSTSRMEYCPEPSLRITYTRPRVRTTPLTTSAFTATATDPIGSPATPPDHEYPDAVRSTNSTSDSTTTSSKRFNRKTGNATPRSSTSVSGANASKLILTRRARTTSGSSSGSSSCGWAARPANSDPAASTGRNTPKSPGTSWATAGDADAITARRTGATNRRRRTKRAHDCMKDPPREAYEIACRRRVWEERPRK